VPVDPVDPPVELAPPLLCFPFLDPLELPEPELPLPDEPLPIVPLDEPLPDPDCPDEPD